MNTLIELINLASEKWWSFSLTMLFQAGILIAIIFLLDLFLRKRIRAVIRYWIWMLILAKLTLPTTLALPTGIGYWCPDLLPSHVAQPSSAVENRAESVSDRSFADSVNVLQPSQINAAPYLNQQPVATHEQQVTSTQQQSSEPRVTSHEPRVTPLTWQSLIFLAWLAGMAALAIVVIQRMLFVRALVAQSHPAQGRLAEVLAECHQKMGMRTNIELRLTKNMLSPAACGLGRPIILMPESLLENLSRQKLRAILTHELVHIRRGDLWLNLVQTILQIAYFYNPLVWIANAIIRQVREQAVDEATIVNLNCRDARPCVSTAVAETEDAARDYAATLVDIAELALSRPHFSLRLVGVVESKKSLAGRIKHIVSRPIPKTAKLGVLGFTAVILIGCTLLPMGKAKVAQPSLVVSKSPSQSDSNVIPAEAGIQSSKFIKHLSNGVTVELVGVCENPSKGKQWWKPDGSPLGFDIETHDASNYTDKNKGYEIAYKFAVPDGVHVAQPKIKGSTSQSDLEVKSPSGIKAVRSHISVWGKTTTIKFPIASGEWKTLGTTSGRGQATAMVGSKKIMFGPAEGTAEKLVLAVTDDLKDFQGEYRLIAITRNGKEIFSKMNWFSNNGLRQHTFVFTGLDIADVSTFAFQTRPYEWVEFKNVSLQPKTDATATQTSKLSSAASETPQLGFLAWQERDRSPMLYWHADGSVVTEANELRITGNLFGMRQVDESHPEYAWLQLYFLHPAFDMDSIIAFRVLGQDGKEIKVDQGSSVTDKSPYTDGLGCVSYTISPGSRDAYPAQCDLELEYAIGPWTPQAGPIPADYRGSYALANSVALGSIGQNVKGEAFIAMIADWSKKRTLQYRFIAVTRDNRELRQCASLLTGPRERVQHEFDFNSPISEIKEFRLQCRPIRKVLYKNVSLKPGVKTNVQIEIARPQPALGMPGTMPGMPAMPTPGSMPSGMPGMPPGMPGTPGMPEGAVKMQPLDFDITSAKFNSGDFINITDLLGTSSQVCPGAQYTVKGKYTLDSHDEAMLHVYATNGEISSQQGPPIKRGEGEFTRTFTVQKPGMLHLSFYPAGPGGEGFGGVYFAPKNRAASVSDRSSLTGTNVVDIKPSDFYIRCDQKRGVCNLVVSIKNDTDISISKFKLNFYRGDPADNLNETGNPHTGWHEAGPIEPGKTWNESTGDFHLPDGKYEFTVVLNYDNAVPETDKNNNTATLKVKISDGRVAEKSVTFDSIISELDQRISEVELQIEKYVMLDPNRPEILQLRDQLRGLKEERKKREAQITDRSPEWMQTQNSLSAPSASQSKTSPETSERIENPNTQPETRNSQPSLAPNQQSSSSTQQLALPTEVKAIEKVIREWVKSCSSNDVEAIKKTELPDRAAKADGDLHIVNELLAANPGWQFSLSAVLWTQTDAAAISVPFKPSSNLIPKSNIPMVQIWALNRVTGDWKIAEIYMQESNDLQIENCRFMKEHPTANIWINKSVSTQHLAPSTKQQVSDPNFGNAHIKPIDRKGPPAGRDLKLIAEQTKNSGFKWGFNIDRQCKLVHGYITVENDKMTGYVADTSNENQRDRVILQFQPIAEEDGLRITVRRHDFSNDGNGVDTSDKIIKTGKGSSIQKMSVFHNQGFLLFNERVVLWQAQITRDQKPPMEIMYIAYLTEPNAPSGFVPPADLNDFLLKNRAGFKSESGQTNPSSTQQPEKNTQQPDSNSIRQGRPLPYDKVKQF